MSSSAIDFSIYSQVIYMCIQIILQTNFFNLNIPKEHRETNMSQGFWQAGKAYCFNTQSIDVDEYSDKNLDL